MRFVVSAILLALSFLCVAQRSRPLNAENPLQTQWSFELTGPNGGKAEFRMDLSVNSNASAEGPRVICPCTGPSQEAFMRGWKDLTVEPTQLFVPRYMVFGLREDLGLGRSDARAIADQVDRKVMEAEASMLALYEVRHCQGEGPRGKEEVWRYGYARATLQVTYKKRNGEWSTLERIAGYYYVPLSTPTLESERPCSEPPKETAMGLGGFGMGMGSAIETISLPEARWQNSSWTIGGLGHAAMPMTSFEMRGIDINQVTVSDVKPVSGLRWVWLPAGLVMMPNVDDVQSMILIEPAMLLVDAEWNASLEAPLAKQLSAYCLDIKKKQPNPAVTFRVGMPRDSVLINLANMSRRSTIKGPWDQARIWIYRDKATLAQVNERLLVSCPPNMYVRALQDVATMGGLRDEDFKNAQLFPANLVGAPPNRKEAGAWYLSVLMQHHPKALRTYLEGDAAEMKTLLQASNLPALDYLAIALRSMLDSMNTDVRLGVLAFLNRQDPATLTKALARKKLDFTTSQELGDDQEIALANKVKAALGM